ncbi:hypothetical protein GIB67_025988 [Kingdonia uniflora]|uniref:tRNA (guanine(9)-N(1))-methyltransferase n=1 Tax=Kingdonia uniflora TaxID=39325 RepID=A0A7J7M2R6_9MAGN|nr:hypothetical protein GIB67_025988 [Kingdonia uniflora]
MLDKSLLKDVRYTKCPSWVYIAAKIKSATSFFQMLYQNRRIRASNVISVKIALWVYIADKIESYLVASIKHLRSKMGSGEYEEVLKPVFVAHFGKVVFHGIPFSNFNTISKISGVEADLGQVKRSFNNNLPNSYLQFSLKGVVKKNELISSKVKEFYHVIVKVFDKDQYQIISCKCSVMGIDRKLELHKMEMNQVHYSVIDMSCLDKNLDHRLMLSTKRILTAQPELHSTRGVLAGERARAIQLQIMFSYAVNGRCTLPAHLWLTGCKGEIQTQLQRLPGFNRWIIEKESDSNIEALQDEKERLVYLTADSEIVLEELDPKSIYIIGGLVDRNRWKWITMKKAIDQVIKTVKLPIGSFLKMSSSQIRNFE